MNSRRIITLTTDFGQSGEYVASMKGVILSGNPDVQIVDISHLVEPGDIHEASFLLGRSYTYFPQGTIHVAVVDPGVGSDRKILAVEAADQFFIGPDNGVLSCILNAPASVQTVYSVENKELFHSPVSRTFHGRDIMAPTAAHLSLGLNIKEVGPPLALADCRGDALPGCRVEKARLTGSVIHIDRFGNLCTNITARHMELLMKKGSCTVRLKNFSIRTISYNYAELPGGHLLACFDSHNHLEIAVAKGSAARYTEASVGDEVIVESDCPSASG